MHCPAMPLFLGRGAEGKRMLPFACSGKSSGPGQSGNDFKGRGGGRCLWRGDEPGYGGYL